ncbi:MAG: hypothetical protein L0241_20945 [Planctomycetia bacterium]|nr:hypothetical protein [Planctomycetia bacterium]
MRGSLETAVLDLFEEELDRQHEFIPLHCHAILTLLSTQLYDIESAARCAAIIADHAESGEGQLFSGARDEVQYLQTEPLRDIFGNPFRSIAFNPAWRSSDVMLLARGIYDEKAFDRMPILADALQDAGCDNEDILNHCRDTNQVHVRGCWVVDLVLGKA